MENPTQNPFDNIAFAISGGGFRAAAYGLGTMSYLHQLQWQGKSILEHVSFVSSTSGGSITNAYYTLRLCQGVPSAEIFHELYGLLKKDKVLKGAVKRLSTSACWKKYPHKANNLINAFAITYDQDLYKGATLQDLADPEFKVHIEEISINSADLNNGISFRFKWRLQDPIAGDLGNHYLQFKKEGLQAATCIRLGDVVAASSCFPMGFEPIVFPNDFASHAQSPAQLWAALETKANHELPQGEGTTQFGLMDGGVVDNQGIYSWGLEDAQRTKNAVDGKQGGHHRPFSLLIISDVASYFVKPYEPPKASKSWWRKIPLLATLAAIAGAAILPFLALVLFALERMPWYNYVMLLPGFLLTFVIGYVLVKIRKVSRKHARRAPMGVLRKHKWQLLSKTLGWWADTLVSRGTSFSLLANDVFLKQIRRMYQKDIYGPKGDNPRLVSNYLHDLSKAHQGWRDNEHKKRPWLLKYKDMLEPSTAIKEVAEAARQVETLLWYERDKPQQLDEVVATGQFTTCYNLLKYICQLEHFQNGVPLSPALETLRQQLLKDWAQFKADPLCKLQHVTQKQ